MKAFALFVYVRVMDFFGLLFLVWAIAAKRGHVNVIKTLLAAGASRISVSVALFAAAKNGNGEVVEVLLDNGADPNGFPGATHVAVVSGSVRTVEALLAAGAHVNCAVSDRGYTPLHFAAGMNDTAMIRSLLVAGANPLATDSSGMRPVDGSRKGSEAAAILWAAAGQTRGPRADAMEPPPERGTALATSPAVQPATGDPPSAPRVARSEPEGQAPAPPRNPGKLRKELARLDAIEDSVARSEIDIARKRVELGLAPITNVSPRVREWVDEGPALAFNAPRHRAEPERGMDVDATVAALAVLCDTVLERHDPPVKWMVADPAMWKDREEERINWLLVASPRNIAVHDGRYSPKTLARAMSYQQSCDPDDNDGTWLTAVRDVLNASRDARTGEGGTAPT